MCEQPSVVPTRAARPLDSGCSRQGAVRDMRVSRASSLPVLASELSRGLGPERSTTQWQPRASHDESSVNSGELLPMRVPGRSTCTPAIHSLHGGSLVTPPSPDEVVRTSRRHLRPGRRHLCRCTRGPMANPLPTSTTGGRQEASHAASAAVAGRTHDRPLPAARHRTPRRVHARCARAWLCRPGESSAGVACVAAATCASAARSDGGRDGAGRFGIATGRGTAAAVGEDDHLPGTSADHARRLHTSWPGSTLTFVPGAGHFPQVENPRAFVDALVAYVDGRRPAAVFDDQRMR